MKIRRREIVLVSGFVLLFSATLNPNPMYASIDNFIYPPTSSPLDLPYNEWGKKFWQWWLSIPAQVSPFPDPKKIDYTCFVGLGAFVVFLADPMITAQTPNLTYECTIPSDRHILILGISELCSYDQDHQTDESLRVCVRERNDFAQQEIFVDGKQVQNVEEFRFTTSFFNVTFPENNIFTYPPSTTKGLVDGTWIMLKPLPPGDHTIEIRVAQIIPGRESENLFLDLQYNLHVTY
jgi:hypothetical protein